MQESSSARCVASSWVSKQYACVSMLSGVAAGPEALCPCSSSSSESAMLPPQSGKKASSISLEV